MLESAIQFKIASEPWEFEEINKLNYETFVEEIPQHHHNDDRVLVDKFHSENIYIICITNQELMGMLALRDNRPFSLDHKLENLDSYLPDFSHIFEIRLLSVKRQYRQSKIFLGLFNYAFEYIVAHGGDVAIISGTVRQIKLYTHIGFVPFGPLVGEEGAKFQPMYINKASFNKSLVTIMDAGIVSAPYSHLSFLPGPVNIHDDVKKVFMNNPISHRCDWYMNTHAKTREMLCKLVNVKNAEILMGSGTLANDVVAAQLSLLGSRGLMYSNGEFGERIQDQAGRAKLDFIGVKKNWGDSITANEIEEKIKNEKNIGWLWIVHCETSTGMLQDIDAIGKVCAKYDVKLCLDCISSIGNIPLNLEQVYLATATSGKGLGSFTGLAIVFYNQELHPDNHKLPRFFDLLYYKKSNGVPFTISSNLLIALNKALTVLDMNGRVDSIKYLSLFITNRLLEMGMKLFVDQEQCLHSVITIQIPGEYSSKEFGDHLDRKGFALSYKSYYLLAKNLVQIVLMGDVKQKNVDTFLQTVQESLPVLYVKKTFKEEHGGKTGSIV